MQFLPSFNPAGSKLKNAKGQRERDSRKNPNENKTRKETVRDRKRWIKRKKKKQGQKTLHERILRI